MAQWLLVEHDIGSDSDRYHGPFATEAAAHRYREILRGSTRDREDAGLFVFYIELIEPPNEGNFL
jgi:hypothetical protein